jgi:phage recombination protein Bet
VNAITKRESGALALPEEEMLKVLQSSLYPGAAPASIKMVLSYCQAAGLDPFQKPVHIVPMWDGKAKQMRDVVMPGVNLYRTQAARSGQFAGMSEPEFGPDVSTTIGGQQITFPEWCRVTVKRLLSNGTVAEFTAREFWMENYATKGGQEKSIAPNAMWTKRPKGQIAKCAAAQALRIAFPEIASQPTADEMEGKQIHPEDAPDTRPEVKTAPPELLAGAAEAAAKGVESYGLWWKSATKEQRALIGLDRHNANKAQAEAADKARTVDAAEPATADLDSDEVPF